LGCAAVAFCSCDVNGPGPAAPAATIPAATPEVAATTTLEATSPLEATSTLTALATSLRTGGGASLVATSGAGLIAEQAAVIGSGNPGRGYDRNDYKLFHVVLNDP
jgi:hypothetical protein